mgnify:CR=1 FL=1
MKKRVLSLLLVLLMVVSLVPISASAATNGHTAQEALAWVRSQLGKSLDYDGVYGAQCVDLIKYYYDYLGCASYARGNGADYASNTLPSGWARYKGAQPQPGDILVYGASSSNPYGHVAIYEADYVTYHQNFNGKQYVVKFTGKYNSCTNPYWGVIRPDFSGSSVAASWEGPTATQITETNAHLDGKVVYNARPNTTQVGVRIYNSSNQLVASKDEYVNYNYTYVTIWYDITGELGVTLVSGQTYKVVFYAIANGKEYWSPTVSFTTLHTHSYKNTVTAPTCTAKGYTTHICSCGNSYKDTYVDALGHNYVSGVCTRCNAKDPNYQAPHTHSYTAAVTAPTCTAAGYTTHICSCGDSYKDNYVDALGHNYVSGVCTRCNAKDPNYQAPHAHSYTAAVIAPTCTSAGYTTHTCQCGNSYKDNYTDALGHNYANGVCTRCGDKSAATLGGNCGINGGDNVKWSLDSSGVLTISGSGKMADYGEEPEECMYRFWYAPWAEYTVKSVVIETGVTNIGAGAFANSKITNISISDTVTDIGIAAFYNSNNIQTITIPDSVKNIGNAAFDRSGLESIVLPNGLKIIDYCMFLGCSNLKSVTIPRTVTSVGWRAFDLCDNLISVYFGGSEAQWGSVKVEEYNDVLNTVAMYYNYKYPDTPTPVTPSGFTDVPSDAFYANAVKWAVENEITTGVGNNRFDPNGQCTRGQVVTFLWRAAGKPTVSANVSFSDVQPGAFYYEAVKWAVANGITTGVGGNRFAPNDSCTRGQVVTFLHRAENSPGVSSVSSFTDVPATAFYYNAVNWAVANGITNGTGNGRFSPNDTCTRGQVVTFLYRAQ